MNNKAAPLKVAIIGAGQVAQNHHIPAFQSFDSVEITALCGRDLAKAKNTAQQFNIQKWYDNVEQLFAENVFDMVSICSPNNLHFAHAMKALDAGCHVFCEKPPALSYSDAKKMMEKAADVNRVLAYNFHNRQLPEVQLLKKMIDEGELGNVYHIRATFIRRRGIPGWGSFTDKETQGGGALMDIGIHVLDLALYLMNFPPVAAVLGNTYDYIGKAGGVGLMGQWDPQKFTVEDSCFAHTSLANGSSITLETAFALNVKAEKEFNLQIHGSKGGATLLPLTLFSERDNQLVDIDLTQSEAINTCQKNIHAFTEACEGKSSLICSAAEGAALQKVVEAIYTSATVNQTIHL
ncbi:MAG: Gfo/Idh/MocA family oxidoreductase [Flavisolibacter sp.]|nr:Gfo/Idh/MocA family oxidoreductase [Flavisolibacter sp.]